MGYLCGPLQVDDAVDQQPSQQTPPTAQQHAQAIPTADQQQTSTPADADSSEAAQTTAAVDALGATEQHQDNHMPAASENGTVAQETAASHEDQPPEGPPADTTSTSNLARQQLARSQNDRLQLHTGVLLNYLTGLLVRTVGMVVT